MSYFFISSEQRVSLKQTKIVAFCRVTCKRKISCPAIEDQVDDQAEAKRKVSRNDGSAYLESVESCWIVDKETTLLD